jgi:hypothetical protein
MMRQNLPTAKTPNTKSATPRSMVSDGPLSRAVISHVDGRKRAKKCTTEATSDIGRGYFSNLTSVSTHVIHVSPWCASFVQRILHWGVSVNRE